MKSRNAIRVTQVWLAGLLVLGCTYGLAGCGAGSDGDQKNGEVYENWAPEAAYVGRDACRGCHPAKYDSFVQSQMGRSWKTARRSLSDADFSQPDPVYDSNRDLYYQPFAIGEALFVREYRVVGGDTVHNRVEQIDFIVGSGHHTNSHIWEINGYLYQIPITWYVQKATWDLAPGFSSRNSRFSRPIPAACMTCHNGKTTFVSGSENRFEAVASGIGCERCHGPGSVHIQAISQGNIVDVTTDVDRTIVNPGKLSPERQWDLCSRCHMQGVDVFRDRTEPDDFRPGRALADYQNVYWPRQVDSVAVFNMASHPDRLSMSKCFRASWSNKSNLAKITCTTCHDPHMPIEARSTNQYTAACQSCHTVPSVPTCTDPGVVAGTITLDCASCHMPDSGTDDIPHVTITDHFIRIPDGGDSNKPIKTETVLTNEEAAAQIRIIRMASLIDSDPTASDIAKGFLSYYEKITDRPEMLRKAGEELAKARQEETKANLSGVQIWYWYLTGDYASIRRLVEDGAAIDNNDAWTQFRVGYAFQENGNIDRAVLHLERAVALAPSHLRFKDKLATAYTNAGKYEEALARFEEILVVNPAFSAALNNRGYTYLIQGRFKEAEEDFKSAIAVDPDEEVALANLASLYLNTDRHEEARPLVERLQRLDPENSGYELLRSALGM